MVQTGDGGSGSLELDGGEFQRGTDCRDVEEVESTARDP